MEAATLRAVNLLAPGRAVDKAAVVAPFLGRGPARSTLYVWVDAILKSGAAGQRLDGQIKAAAATRGRRAATREEKDVKRTKARIKKRVQRRAQPGDDKAQVAADVVAEHLPHVTTIDDIAGTGPIRVIEYLNECITAARAVMEYAKGEDGKPRAAKMLLLASEHLRRCLDTSNRILEKVHEIQRVEEFHRLIMEEVRRADPETAKRILERIDRLSREWGAL